MKSLSDLMRDMANARKNMEKFADALPRVIGVESVRIVKANFSIQAYDSGNGITKWPARKASTNAQYDRGKTVNSKTGKLSKYRSGKNSVYKGSVYSSANPLLLQTHNLFNSIHYVASKKRVFVGINLSLVPQGKAINEGLAHQPQRQFLPKPSDGANPKIINAVGKRIKYETDKAMRAFKK